MTGEEQEKSVKHNQTEDVFEIVPQIKINPDTGKIIAPDQQEKTIEFSFMFLNNLTSNEEG